MGTKYKGSPEEIHALDAYICLVRAADSITNRLNHHLNDFNLTVSQFGILETLFHLGSMCQKQLSTKILKSTANITTVIDNLEKRDLVKRVRQKDDRRFITVELTEKGKKLIKDVFPKHVENIVTEMSLLNKEEKGNLKTLCKRLGTQNPDYISANVNNKEE